MKLNFLFIFLFSYHCLLHAQSQPTSTTPPPGLKIFEQILSGLGAGPTTATSLNYNFSFNPAADGPSQTNQHRLNAATPLYKSEQQSLSANLNTSTLDFADNVVLSTPPTIWPEHFYKVELGMQYSKQVTSQKTFGLRFNAGSASDKLFATAEDTIFNASATFAFPEGDRSHWILTVFISNNSTLLNYVPLPGFIYLYRGDKFIGMFGIPFTSLRWNPSRDWTYSFSLFGPSINSEIVYGAHMAPQAFVGFNWSQQSFMRYERVHDKDRIFLDEKKFLAGWRQPFSKQFSFEINSGYAFARKVSEGPKFYERDRGEARLDDAIFATTNLRYIF